MELGIQLQRRIEEAERSVEDIAKILDMPNERAGWLEQQLRHILSQLVALSVDLDAGVTVLELGFNSADDLIELLNDLATEIESLRCMIRAESQIQR